jgi:TonB family protein
MDTKLVRNARHLHCRICMWFDSRGLLRVLNISRLIIPTFILAILASPQRVIAQNPATAAVSNLEQMAHQLAEQLPAQHLHIIVIDFSAPDNRSLPFGAYLAGEFWTALTKYSGPFDMVDRKQLSEVVDSIHLRPVNEFEFSTSLDLAKMIGANCIVRGSYGEFNGALGVTIRADLIPEVIRPGNDSMAGFVNGKLSLTPDMASHLDEPLESLHPKGSIPASGTAGMTAVRCLQCPQPVYSDAARTARLEGTVILSALITAEGRAASITVVKGMGMGLDENTIETVRIWKFAPALDPDGKPATVQLNIVNVFHLN